MRKHLKSGFHFVFPITCLIAFMAIFLVAQAFHLDDSRLFVHKATTFNSGWRLMTEAGEVSLPTVSRSLTAEHGSIILKNTLPPFDGSGNVLCFKTNSETVPAGAGSVRG